MERLYSAILTDGGQAVQCEDLMDGGESVQSEILPEVGGTDQC